MPARVGVGVMAALLVLYVVVLVQFAVGLLRSGGPVPVAMGVALAVLPLLGLWALGAELLFGFRSQRLGNIMSREGSLPDDEFAMLPSGRPDRKSVAPHLDRFRAAADAFPNDWRAAFRLGLALDAAGQRRLARGEIVRAIRIERAGRGASAEGAAETS